MRVSESREQRMYTVKAQRSSDGGQKQVYRVVKVWKQCGKAYLSIVLTTESEVADTGGSTATDTPL